MSNRIGLLSQTTWDDYRGKKLYRSLYAQ